MSAHLRQHAAMLRTISKARPDLRRKLLQLADEGLSGGFLLPLLAPIVGTILSTVLRNGSQ
ncbi:hypothetical protein B566_EDAN017510 [Ephemera danica]|nr:hypothetical protein B566_EDAN017510 [Ephemera danica]